MANPVLVEVTRADRVESAHRGAFVIVDPDGKVVASAGDIDRSVYPRSAIKILQALPFVESGWADRYGLTDPELALACASHAGDPIHTSTAAAMLGKLGFDETTLECGVHWPSSKRSARQLARDGTQPSQLHNNCSGKHAGMLCVACATGVDPEGYVGPDHPVQRLIADALREVYGVPLADPGTDGCSIPTYAVPLRAVAQAFARLATGASFGPQRAAAAGRLRRAVAAHPELTAGMGRLDTDLGARFGERLYTKTGAEGVFCASIPERGWGLALKCDDGTTRASELMLVTLVRATMGWTDEDGAALAARLDPVLRNWNGMEVGRLRPTVGLSPSFSRPE